MKKNYFREFGAQHHKMPEWLQHVISCHWNVIPSNAGLTAVSKIATFFNRTGMQVLSWHLSNTSLELSSSENNGGLVVGVSLIHFRVIIRPMTRWDVRIHDRCRRCRIRDCPDRKGFVFSRLLIYFGNMRTPFNHCWFISEIRECRLIIVVDLFNKYGNAVKPSLLIYLVSFENTQIVEVYPLCHSKFRHGVRFWCRTWLAKWWYAVRLIDCSWDLHILVSMVLIDVIRHSCDSTCMCATHEFVAGKLSLSSAANCMKNVLLEVTYHTVVHSSSGK